MGGMRGPLWSSLVVIGLIGAVVGSGVFAVMSDVESSAQNVLQGGSVDLKTDGGDGTTTFSARDVGEGDLGNGTTRLSNVGSNPGDLTVKIEDGDIRNAPGVTYESEPRPDEGEMGQYAEMALFIDRDRDGVFDGNDTGLSSARVDALSGECLQYGAPDKLFDPIDDYEGCSWPDVERLGPDVDFLVDWRMPEGHGNETQGDQVFVEFTYVLTQAG